MTAEPPDAADRRRAYKLIRHRATNNNTGMHAVLTAGLPRGPQMVTALCDAYIAIADQWHTADDHTALVAQLDQATNSPDPVTRTAAAIVMLHGISCALDEPTTLNQQLHAIAANHRIGTLCGGIIDIYADLLPKLTDPEVLDWLTAKAEV
jgi:hypothetical protein